MKKELVDELEEEVSFDDFDFEDFGLWEIFVVDLKVVVNLFLIVEKYIGFKLDLVWIKCGGYDLVLEVVNYLME